MPDPTVTPHTNIGPGDILLVLVLVLGIGGGLALFFTKLLGRAMAFGLATTLVIAGLLWLVAPIYSVACLILGIPLTVGIVRGLTGKHAAPGGTEQRSRTEAEQRKD
jgi:hypothetical protein